MCGFVGFRAYRNGFQAASMLDAALGALRHRGLDDAGKLIIGKFACAHARLSIIDLTDAARQPIVDATGRFVLLFNGEIYNYRGLADSHFAEDTHLNRASDTAVLLAMYERFGRDCLDYLSGMFAFAVIDLQTESVFLARDRFGEKPLYWVATSKCIAFASEISALKRLLPDCDWAIDSTALLLYQTVGSVPAPYSIYRAARALRPAHWIEINGSGGIKEGTYWSVGELSFPVPRDRDEAIEGCRHRLLNAVRSRMVSDVPVGLFLSGGLDSGSILSLMSSLRIPCSDALCIDFVDSRFSEYHLAAQTASAFGTRLHRSVVTSEAFEAHLDRFFRVTDQPTTDGFNTYFVALHARALGIKVWLSGVGGDELFGGYPSFRRVDRLVALSQALQLAMPGFLPKLVARWFPQRYRWARVLYLNRPGDQRKRAYQCLRNPIPIAIARQMLSQKIRIDDQVALALLDGVYPETGRCIDRFQRASVMETGVYMASQLLRDIDNFSMAHSIEVRAPFLDHDLFSYVFALPQRFKNVGGRSKPLLIDSLPHELPAAISSAPKRGFAFPLELWLKKDLRASFEEYVLDERNSEFWDLGAVRDLWRAHLAGKVHWAIPWQFYAFARWHRAQHA
jgi:asparagine synthase (glutamine-hydrolysing)